MANAQRGRCNNFGNCTKADTGEIINIINNSLQPPICPECGLNLQPYNKRGSKEWLIFFGAIALVAAGGTVLYGYINDTPKPDCIKDKKDCTNDKKDKEKDEKDKVPSICSPLLMEGKKSLYQRVLIKPNSHKYTELGGISNQTITPFSRYYVYDRQTNNNEEWLNIGSSTHCKKDGWVKTNETLEWKQQLTLTFKNPSNRDRAYFFKDQEGLQNALKESTTIQENDPRLVAVEPKNYVDPEKNFYITPILEFSTQNDINLLKIATATVNSNTPSSGNSEPEDSAIVFVIDTTISMKPYIEEVRKAVNKVYERFHNSSFRSHVKFGLIAFRSNIKAKPELEYVTKLFVDPAKPQEEQNFSNIVSHINEASVSSLKFDEDSYAGVSAAIHQIQWEKFPFGRNIILITDAGAIEPNEKLPDGTQISAIEDLTGKTINDIAQKTKEINIYALHLKTPNGKAVNNHAKAENQYKTLTFNNVTNTPLYYSREIKEQQTDFFGDTLDCIAQRSAAEIIKRLENSQASGVELNTDYCPQTPLETANPDYAKEKEQIRKDQLLLGNALRLKYLGAKEGTKIPDVVEGWINDKTPEASSLKVQVNVLLSRAELSTLAEKIDAILKSESDYKSDTGSQAEQFFNNLKKNASAVIRDPKLLNDDSTVGEMLNLEELADLPYKSDIIKVSKQDWIAIGYSGQQTLLSTLRSKLKAYKDMEETKTLWHKLTEETDPTDEVALIPLDLLP